MPIALDCMCGPSALRSCYIIGIPELQRPQHATLLQRVQHANSSVIFSGSTLLQAVSSSLAAIAENPRNLYYWEFPELVQFSAFEGVNSFTSDCWGCVASTLADTYRSSVVEVTQNQSGTGEQTLVTPCA